MHANNVTLIDYMGSDRTHAVNAWASTFLDLELNLPDDIHARTDAGMPRDRAKETARYFKAYNTQINVMRSLSFDGLVQVWQKRGAHTKAQREVAAVV